MLAHKVELHYGCCKMQVKILQVTATGHSKGQWLIGCTKNSVVYEMRETLMCFQSFDFCAENRHGVRVAFFYVKLSSLCVT